MNRKTKDIFEKIIVILIGIIFITGAFIPAVSSQSKSGQGLGSSEMISTGEDEPFGSFSPGSSAISLDIGSTILDILAHTALGLVNIAIGNPIISGICSIFAGEDKSSDMANRNTDTDQLVDDQLAVEEQEIRLQFKNPNTPFPLDIGDPWWNTDWQYRKEITVNHTKVAANLSNFPVLINSTDDDLKNDAQPDGDDIVFTDASSIKLNHEIELFDNTTGELVCWVNVTNLLGSTNTTVYMYYGNSSCSSQQNPSGVWDSHYMTVQHLNETTGIHLDSTSYNNDGTCNGGVTQDAAGKIDGADSFDGTDDYVDVGNDASLRGMPELTISFWTKIDSLIDNGAFLGWWSTTPSNRKYLIRMNSDGSFQGYIAPGGNQIGGSFDGVGTLSTDVWSYLSMTWDGSTWRGYRDGVSLPNTFSGSGSISNSSEGSVRIGDDNTASGIPFDGIIDEFLISDISRNSSWIITSFNNQFDPSSFYDVGAEEVLSGSPYVFNENPERGAVDVSLNPVLSADINDAQDDSVNWWILTNASGGWTIIENGTLQTGNGTVSTSNTSSINAYTWKYWWSVNATDLNGSGNWTNETYSFTTRPENYAPSLSDPLPPDEAISIGLMPQLSINCSDRDNDLMNLSWYENTTGGFVKINENNNISNGTYYCTFTNASSYSTRYWWKVNVSDGEDGYNEKIYFFTTKDTPNNAPILSNPVPANGSDNISPGQVVLMITAQDLEENLMNVTFRTNATTVTMEEKLIKNYQSKHSSEPHDYLEEMVTQIKKDPSEKGFWDTTNQNWIRSLSWNGSDWSGYSGHDWKYSMICQEGAMHYAINRGTGNLDEQIIDEFNFMNSSLNPDGSISGIGSQPEYKYGMILSSFSLGYLYFDGVNQSMANQCLNDTVKVYDYVKSNWESPSTSSDYSMLLRGYSNAWKTFNKSGDTTKAIEALGIIQNYSQAFISAQGGSGAWDGCGAVQQHLKRSEAVLFAYDATSNASNLMAVRDNMEYILANLWDSSTGGVIWTPGNNEFYEEHQMQFITTMKMLYDRSNGVYDYTNELIDAWLFLTDNNYAGIDMYVHNYDNHGAFFSYRNILNDGSIQPGSFKGSYEIGTALIALSLNYNLTQYQGGGEEKLIQNYQSDPSSEPHDYLEEMVTQIKKDPSEKGFWDTTNQNWIRSLSWNGSDWSGYSGHDWKYSMICQEGAMHYAINRDTGNLDEQIIDEFNYMNSSLNPDGSISGIGSQPEYKYGVILSSLALGYVYFDGMNQSIADQCLNDTVKVYSYVKSNWESPSTSSDYSMLLRGYSNTWKAFNKSGDTTKANEVLGIIENYSHAFINAQGGSGDWGGCGSVQQHEKRNMAVLLAYDTTGNATYLTAARDNIEYILANLWDPGTGGVIWTPGNNEFYECHQCWFMICLKMLYDRSNGVYDYTDELIDTWLFLTDNNYAGIDMYVHNYDNHGAFFSYRNILNDGSVQPGSFKGSYEIGVALWGLSINYNLTQYVSGWHTIGTNFSVNNGTYAQTYIFNETNKTYWWSVNCTDSQGNWTNRVYHFTTVPYEVFIWNCTLDFNGPDSVSDLVVFGETSDASDGQDSYDVPKPGAPPSPYVYAWFDANLSGPYDRLWEDYREYPDTYKVWDMYVEYENASAGNIMVSWDSSSLNRSEYGSVLLNDTNSSIDTDMLSNSNYTFVASPGSVRHFRIICSAPVEYIYNVSLGEDWNLVSLPVNQSVHKDNITVSYLGVNYTWQQAVDNGTILGFIYGWNTANQNYVSTDILEPGKGYWMYAYYECDLLIFSNTSNNGDYITNLQEEWNLIGLPYDTMVAKENLTVYYNGTEYTWQQAVDNGTILGFIYGWNTANQNYVSTDILEPGKGYWMYAYEACILNKE